MKVFLSFSTALILAFAVNILAQPANDTLYLNFNSHCEESDKDPTGTVTLDYTKSQTLFAQYRAYVKQIADMVRSKGAKWDYQSDWNFLLAAQQFDKGDATTNGKNIIQWLNEDNNGQINVDPHAHQNAYNYADVAYLIDQLSPTIKATKVVGGFTWNGPMGNQTLMGTAIAGYTWDSLSKGLRLRKYYSANPTYTWKADVLLGGATYDYKQMQTAHGQDINAVGAWRPRDTTSVGFFTHVCGGAIATIGVGGDALLGETTSVATDAATIMGIIRSTLAAMQIAGNRGKFYAMQIQTNQRDFSRAGYMDKINTLLDSLKPLAASGQIKWATHMEKFTAWKTLYNEKPNFYPRIGTDPCSSTQAATPSLTASLASLPDFGVVEIGKTSTPQNYTLSGANLGASVTINASAGFQVGASANGAFASTLTLTPSNGSLSTTVFARFAPTATGVTAGTITHTSQSAGGTATTTVKTSGTGKTAVGVRENAADAGLHVQPNPATNESVVRFTLEQRESVRLALYDVLGREVALVLDAELEAGEHNWSLVVRHWSLVDGAYFLRLQTRTFSQTQLVQVIR